MPQPSYVIVIGASAGGIEAIKKIVSRLPADFPASILIVVHIGANQSNLPQLLSAYGKLPARYASDGDPLCLGEIIVAPPDRHLLIEENHLRLSAAAKENFSRPAIDPLFRTAAAFRSKVIGIVLSGYLDDGTNGLQAIKAHGGIAIVQDPADALAPSMPQSALDHVAVDYRLPAAGIAKVLCGLVANPTTPLLQAGVSELISLENGFNPTKMTEAKDLATIAKPSLFTCPECHGDWWEISK